MTTEPPQSRFNPVLGFLSAATSERMPPLEPSPRFNPVLGFLSAATTADRRGYALGRRVSIPFWVFSPLRPTHGVGPARKDTFQSRSGFSLRCDTDWRVPTNDQLRVSIPFWVFSPLRHMGPRNPADDRQVSIPFWVFSPLRPSSSTPRSTVISEFQSRSGFSLRCDDDSDSGSVVSVVCFNPVLGFLSAATDWFSYERSLKFSFQSRSGFSLRCDRLLAVGVDGFVAVSIPFWVFSPLRLVAGVVAVVAVVGFQSRSGFSLRCDGECFHHSVAILIVSIPFWVFSPLRLSLPKVSRPAAREFQSRSGFSLRCDAKTCRHQIAYALFQSRSGFSLRCDPSLWTYSVEDIGVSIPFWVFSPLRQYDVDDTQYGIGMFQSRSGFSLRCDR